MLPDPLAAFKGPTSKEADGRKGVGRGREGKGVEGRGGEGKRSGLPLHIISGYATEFPGDPLQCGCKIHVGWEKFAVFDGNRRLS